MHDVQDTSIHENLCSTFITSKRDMIFSLHLFYFKVVIFTQLFFDLRNHLFRKKMDDDIDLLKILNSICTSINIFMYPMWGLIECNIDYKLKWIFPTGKLYKY